MAQFDQSDEWARTAITLGEQKDFLPAQAIGHEFLAENTVCRGEWDESFRQTAQNRQLADKMGALNRQAWSEYPRIEALWNTGRLPEAYQIAQTALDLCERIGETRLAAWIEPMLVLIATDLNEDEDAERYAWGALRRGESLGQVALHGNSLHAMGYWHMKCQKWEEAVQYFQQMDTLLRPTENRIIFLYSHAFAAEALLGSGRVEESMELVDEALELADFAKAAHLRALSKRVQAQTFAKLAHPVKAADAFEEAISDLERLGSRLELGRAHYHRAEMFIEIGEFGKARVDAERAVTILADCSARRDTQRAETLIPQ